MTIPFDPAVTQAIAVAYAALTEWRRTTDALAVEASKLATAAGRGDVAAVARLTPAVQSLLAVASKAASAYGDTRAAVPPDAQSRWVSVVTRTYAALSAAQKVGQVGAVPSQGAPMLPPLDLKVPNPNSGLRIPGTNIVVPWVAVIGSLIVIGAGIWVSRRKRRAA